MKYTDISEDIFITLSNKVIITDNSKKYTSYRVYDMNMQKQISSISYAGVKDPIMTVFDTYLIVRNKFTATIWDYVSQDYKFLPEESAYDIFRDENYKIKCYSSESIILYSCLSDNSKVYFVSYSHYSGVYWWNTFNTYEKSDSLTGDDSFRRIADICVLSDGNVLFAFNGSLDILLYDPRKSTVISRTKLHRVLRSDYIHSIISIPGNKCIINVTYDFRNLCLHVVDIPTMKCDGYITLYKHGFTARVVGTFSNGYLLYQLGDEYSVYNPYKNINSKIKRECNKIYTILSSDMVVTSIHEKNTDEKLRLQLWV